MAGSEFIYKGRKYMRWTTGEWSTFITKNEGTAKGGSWRRMSKKKNAKIIAQLDAAWRADRLSQYSIDADTVAQALNGRSIITEKALALQRQLNEKKESILMDAFRDYFGPDTTPEQWRDRLRVVPIKGGESYYDLKHSKHIIVFYTPELVRDEFEKITVNLRWKV